MADVPRISQGPWMAAPLEPLAPVADPGAVDQFNAAMTTASAPAVSSPTRSLSFNADGSLAPATDEQLAMLGPSELAALQRKFGADDLGLRQEAAAILALKDQMGKDFMMAMMRDMQKRISESKG